MIVVILRNFTLVMILVFIMYTLLEQKRETFAEVKTNVVQASPQSDVDDLYKFVFQKSPAPPKQQSPPPQQHQHFFRPYDTLDPMFATIHS